MNSEAFIKAVKNIVKEKGISEDIVFEGMEQALTTAYKKNFDSKTNVRVEIDRETGEIKVFSYLIVVDDVDFGSEEVDEEGNVVKIDICSKCHPFYTGKQKIVDTSGRVEKFKKKFNV